MTSSHLDGIISKQHGSTAAFVVFVDIVKYSLRKSIMQQSVIQEFSKCLSSALDSISAKYVGISQKQNLNLSTDIIKIPTGDGAAIVFPFSGMQNMHLDFSLDFLSSFLSSRRSGSCSIFDSNGWCNCHSFFDVRIGVSEGKVIVFKDVNQNYNVAGGTINMASRVMGLADKQQIIFTQDAYSNVIDMTEDIQLESKFVMHGSVEVKHGVKIDVCQYVGDGENYLNKEVPIRIKISKKEAEIRLNDSPFNKSIRSYSLHEKLENLEIIDILKEMPFPPGMEAIFKGPSNTIIDKDAARALVDAFKVINALPTGKVAQVIEAPSED